MATSPSPGEEPTIPSTEASSTEVMIEPDPPSGGYGDGQLLNAGARSDTILNACFPQKPRASATADGGYVVATDSTQILMYRSTISSESTITEDFPEGVSMMYSGAPDIAAEIESVISDPELDADGVAVGGAPGVTKVMVGVGPEAVELKWPIPNLNSSPMVNSEGEIVQGAVGAEPSLQGAFNDADASNTPGRFHTDNYGSGDAVPSNPSTTAASIKSTDSLYGVVPGRSS